MTDVAMNKKDEIKNELSSTEEIKPEKPGFFSKIANMIFGDKENDKIDLEELSVKNMKTNSIDFSEELKKQKNREISKEEAQSARKFLMESYKNPNLESINKKSFAEKIKEERELVKQKSKDGNTR